MAASALPIGPTLSPGAASRLITSPLAGALTTAHSSSRAAIMAYDYSVFAGTQGVHNHWKTEGRAIFNLNPDEAIEFYEKALAISTELDYKEAVATVSGNIGIIYFIRGDFERAMEFQKQALAMNAELGYKRGMANNYGNLGVIYRRRGELDEAE